MPCELYIPRKFSASVMVTIDRANAIIVEYQKQGFTLTLRQLYYQFVARGLIPNSQKEYGKLGVALNNARLAGLVDWEAIEDRTRNLEEVNTWKSPQAILNAVANQYQEDIWQTQPDCVEVWVEKEALVGVIERVCTEFQVPYFACRGYSSQSEQWRAGKRILERAEAHGQRTIILHFGDHDPSGIDMTRDNIERLEMFSENNVEVRRLALNMDQVKKYRPPPNPAKMTDSRSEGYVAAYGDKSWELDALDPKVIDALIRNELNSIIDAKLWQRAKKKVEVERARLKAVAERWETLHK